MNVLVDTADNENFVVVANWLSSEKLFRLLKGALHSFDLTNLGVESEAVRNPAVVASEDKNLRVIEREAAHGVSGRPIVLTVDKDNWLPLLLVKVAVSVQTLNAIKGLFILRVATSNNIEVSPIENTN